MKRVLSALCLGLLMAVPSDAQTITASLEGIVRDASGAVVPRAKAVIVNTGTNATVQATTDKEGRFLAPALRPGAYAVTVEAQGFKKAERTGITLEVNQAALMEIVLEVGALEEIVTISGRAPLLEATTSAVGQVIDNKRIMDLPLNTRNPYDLVALVPGVTGGSSMSVNGANQFSVNGGRWATNDILIDGIPSAPSNDTANQPSIFPSVDAVQEFRLQTNNFSAEFGRAGGGIVNLIYKSGTNAFKGSAYEFYRDAKFDERTFFAKRTGTPLPDSSRHQFGATLGGPIRQDRTFFLLSYDGRREQTAFEQFFSVPTEAMRRGDFSQLLRAGQPIVIYDPLTTVRVGTSVTRQAFPGNLIPSGRIDPVAARALRYFPLPNRPGTDVFQNYFVSTTDPNTIDQFDVKVDHQFSNRQRVNARYSRFRNINAPPAAFPADIAIADQQRTTFSYGRNVAVDYYLTASPTLLVNVRYGFAHQSVDLTPQSLGFDPVKEWGMPSYISDVPRSTGEPLVMPNISPAGYLGIGGNAIGSGENPFQVHTWQVGVTKVAKRHLLKSGGEMRWFFQNTSQYGRTTGDFAFPTSFTQANPLVAAGATGDGFASFLLGTGNSGTGWTQGFKTSHTRSSYWAGYVNDDWKVSSKLTLNLGVRYEVELPRYEVLDRTNFFDRTVSHPLGAQIQGRPGVELCPACANLRGGPVFVGVNGVSRRAIATDWNNVSPRVGLAYQVLPKTVVRGAYGIIYAPSPAQASGTIGQTGFRADTPWVGTLDNGLTPNNLLRDPFPAGPVPRPGSAQGLMTSVGLSFSNILWPDTVASTYTEHWSAGIQRELPGAMLIDVAYVAHRGVNLIESGDTANFNEVPSQYWSPALLEAVPNPFVGLVPATSPIAGATVPRGRLLRPYPHFDGIPVAYSTGASSIYHSLQVKTEKRFSSGLGFLVSYTWGKLVDDTSGIAQQSGGSGTTQTVSIRDRAVSPLDVSHQVVASYVYALPFGRGQRFGQGWSGALEAILGGWQVNGITTWRTGNPLTISTTNTCTNCFNPGLRPNLTGDPALDGPVRDRLDRYFDTSVFSQPAPYTLGSAPRTLSVRSHGRFNTDVSLFKNLRVRQGWTLQCRAEAYNVFDYVQFGAPNTNFAGGTSPTFGRITTQANVPRQLQFAVKLLF